MHKKFENIDILDIFCILIDVNADSFNNFFY